MFRYIFSNKLVYVLLSIYIVLVLWWLRINFTSVNASEVYLFNWSYGLLALIGSINGIVNVSRVWGGYKSIVGKGIIFLSLGLFGEWFGLQIWTYYNLVAKIDMPYPSLADLGYFSIIPFYGYGIFLFSKAAGSKLSLKTGKGKIFALIIPLIMVGISYFLFLKNLSVDFTNVIRTFLDFGYPLGEAISISIAILTYILSKNILGGRMKSRILFLIFALIVQYVTDYTFLFQASQGVYKNGGVVDIMYASSLFIMSVVIISFRSHE